VTAAGTLARPAPARRRWLTRNDVWGYAFLSPWLIGFLVFTLFPFVASLFLSLTNWQIVGSWRFVGLRNFITLLTGGDVLFLQALRTTGIYVLFHVPGVQIIALALALLLNQRLRGLSAYRTIFYLPAVTAGVATSFLWAQIFASNGGLLNTGLGLLGIQGPNWLYSMEWSLPALIIMSFWNVGTIMLIYLAALQGVPRHLYDAAMIDGAGLWGRFLHVTVPMITPAIFFNVVQGIIGSFQVFTAAFIITAGGPANATLFYSLYLYRVAFQQMQMGFASALAWILFVIILAATIVQLLVAKYWVYYEGEPAMPTGGAR
jgi:multiple sugar transport system permease protein